MFFASDRINRWKNVNEESTKTRIFLYFNRRIFLFFVPFHINKARTQPRRWKKASFFIAEKLITDLPYSYAHTSPFVCMHSLYGWKWIVVGRMNINTEHLRPWPVYFSNSVSRFLVSHTTRLPNAPLFCNIKMFFTFRSFFSFFCSLFPHVICIAIQYNFQWEFSVWVFLLLHSCAIFQ